MYASAAAAADQHHPHRIDLSDIGGTETVTTPARTVLSAFLPDTAPAARHPEQATTACSCRSPEPCFDHGPVPPLDTATEVSYGDYLAERAAAEPAPSVCQCSAPDPCRTHCDERPLLQRPPAWNDPHPDSPVARTRRRLEHDRAMGVLPGAEPGQGVDVLPFLTDYELGAWTHALLAEHHRRQQRFADYRGGARAAQIRDDARRLA